MEYEKHLAWNRLKKNIRLTILQPSIQQIDCTIGIILQCNTEHKNVFLHIPGLKITQIKIPRNVVDVFGTLTTWRHMKTSSLKRKDQTSFGFMYASILIKFNKNKFAR